MEEEGQLWLSVSIGLVLPNILAIIEPDRQIFITG
jgi:hypothetical protein